MVTIPDHNVSVLRVGPDIYSRHHVLTVRRPMRIRGIAELMKLRRQINIHGKRSWADADEPKLRKVGVS